MSSASMFGTSPIASRPRRPAAAQVAAPRTVVVAPTEAPPAAPEVPDVDAALLDILRAPSRPGETVAVAYARRERDLVDAFARLPVLAARALHKRLANPQPGDELAAQFSRLVIERRTRLLTYLADARRREALARR